MQSSSLLGALLCGLVATAGLIVGAGCDSQPYCINCGANADGDGGVGDGDGGGGTPDANRIDSGIPSDACVNSGVEVCDGLDNDCDMSVDEGSLDGVGVACSTDTGECTAGTTECVNGAIVCGGGAVLPVPELCDNLDNDCDGVNDNGDPEGGGICGSDLGECVAGIKRCMNGGIVCFGEVTADPGGEVCDTKDNDCDGRFDEGIPTMGSCGPAQGNTGECQLGVRTCIGGQFQCVGARYPQVEQCDALDRDCDGNPTNGFALDSDATRCGSCTNNCTDDFGPSDHVASVYCNAGTCAIGACEEDYFDRPPNAYADGCETFCDTYKGPFELCNNEDDDCDGMVDEAADLTAPIVCDAGGMNCRDVCAIPGTPCSTGASQCVSGGWVCNGWPGYVETDGSGNLVSETLCDDLDNDCDGLSDESYPAKGGACNDGGIGICARTGTNACNGTNDGLVCSNLSPVVNPRAETCNNLDDDCMGDIDEGFTNGSLSEWVDIGDGVEIFAYEASRPDATSLTAGARNNAHVCSKADALPWTGLTQPEAEARCTAIGARLCTEFEWERACMTLREDYQQGGSPNFLVTMETEDYDSVTQGADFGWFVVPYPGASGTSAMWPWPNSNRTYSDNSGPHMDYDINFTQTGTHYVWVRGNDWQGGNFDDIVHVGLNGTIPTSGNTMGRWGGTNTWTWVGTRTNGNRVSVNVPSVGVHTLNLFWADEAIILDKIIVTTSAAYTPTGTGPVAACGWSYSSNCDTYAANTCNGNDYDTDPGTAGDQDAILATGTMAQCYASWGGVGQRIYDMSGNVKEWTAERSANNNPFRGGASNNTGPGISCKSDFGVVDDNFSFPNVGFRCCR